MAVYNDYASSNNSVILNVPRFHAPGPYTVTMWFKRIGTTASRSNFLWDKTAGGNSSVGSYSWNVANTTFYRTSDETPPNDNERVGLGVPNNNTDGAWLSWYYSDTSEADWIATTQIYVNGLPSTMSQGSDNMANSLPSTIPGSFYLGNRYEDDRGFDGYFAEFSVIKGRLPLSYIQKLHQGHPANSVVEYSSLIAYAPLRKIGDPDRVGNSIAYGSSIKSDNTHPSMKDTSNSTPVHIRSVTEIDREEYPTLFPNLIIEDTFTDTNSTLIDAHTPDLDAPGYGWERLEGATGGADTGPVINDNRLNFTGNGSNQAARIRTGIKLSERAIKFTGKAGQINNNVNQLSFYFGTSTISSATNATWPAKRFVIHFDSGATPDQLSIKGSNYDATGPNEWKHTKNFDWGGTGNYFYWEILLFSNHVYEVRVWPVRTDIGGGEVAYGIDYPIDPNFRNRMIPEIFSLNDELYLTIMGWYGSGLGWETDWLKIEATDAPVGATTDGKYFIMFV